MNDDDDDDDDGEELHDEVIVQSDHKEGKDEFTSELEGRILVNYLDALVLFCFNLA